MVSWFELHQVTNLLLSAWPSAFQVVVEGYWTQWMDCQDQ